MMLSQGITIRQVAGENPLLTQVLTGAILVMLGTLIARRREEDAPAALSEHDVPLLTQKQSDDRIKLLRKLGCKIEIRKTAQGASVFPTCPPGTKVPPFRGARGFTALSELGLLPATHKEVSALALNEAVMVAKMARDAPTCKEQLRLTRRAETLFSWAVDNARGSGDRGQVNRVFAKVGSIDRLWDDLAKMCPVRDAA